MTKRTTQNLLIALFTGVFLFLLFPVSSRACDTWVALGNSTTDGSVILGKNSDRPSLEAQPLKYQQRMKHKKGEGVQCTYISVPQVNETYAHIGSKIWWLFGYEMGMNEWGVAIGNEAVWSREPYEETGLLGMDLIRLALERSKTAYEAMHVIISLINTHGQGGGCEYPEEWDEKSKYHNSFIVADPNEAWVLETAGRFWVAKKVVDVWAISNIYTIEDDFDEAHPDLIQHAIQKGWCDSEKNFNFSRCYMDFTGLDYARAQNRASSNRRKLLQHKGEITVEFMMNEMCRNHLEGTINEPRWAPNESWFAQPCLHDIPKISPYRTAASMVAHLRKDMPPPLRQVYWASFSLPCVNVFQPFYMVGKTVPVQFGEGTHKYSPNSPWWWAEKTKRLCDLNYNKLAPIVKGVFGDTEKWELTKSKRVEAEAVTLIEQGKEKEAEKLLQEFCKECVNRTEHEYKMLHDILEQTIPTIGVNFIWLDFLRQNCKRNDLSLPGL